MSGHSHWAGIKHKKGSADQKRGLVFSKLLNAISIAAKTETNPQFNPRLRTAIEKAQQNNVPKDNIERAIKRATEQKDLEELLIEAYGPEGSAILIEAITDSRNRTISEVKKILSDNNAKFGEQGSVKWAFESKNSDDGIIWEVKFKQEISEEAKQKLQELIEELEERDDVQKIYTNI
ncbi:MAG: YebC/PmpR family DNA-binding transcriptional regulator [Candidatus Paceibacterota bacterium]